MANYQSVFICYYLNDHQQTRPQSVYERAICSQMYTIGHPSRSASLLPTRPWAGSPRGARRIHPIVWSLAHNHPSQPPIHSAPHAGGYIDPIPSLLTTPPTSKIPLHPVSTIENSNPTAQWTQECLKLFRDHCSIKTQSRKVNACSPCWSPKAWCILAPS
jgi:hypothetical protein